MMTLENLVLVVVVGVAVFFLARALWKVLAGKKPACSCQEANCPLADACSKVEKKEKPS